MTEVGTLMACLPQKTTTQKYMAILMLFTTAKVYVIKMFINIFKSKLIDEFEVLKK